MKKKVIAPLSLALALALVLSGCSFGGNNTDDKQENKSAMGRYIETQIEFPEKFVEFSAMQMEDGSYLMLGKIFNEQQDYTENHLYESSDDGKSWTEIEPDWLKSLAECAIHNVILTDQNNGFVFYSQIDMGLYEQIDALFLEKKDDEGIALMESLDRVGRLENGVVIELESFPKTSIGYNASVVESFISPAGDLLVYDVFDVVLTDTGTGEAILSYPIELNGYSMGTCSVYDDKIAHISADGIAIYDIRKGELISKLEVQQEGSVDSGDSIVVAKDKTTNAFYYASPKGIFRILGDGSLTEKVVDNTLNSLGMPTNNITKLFVNENKSFLVATRDSLYCYKFDETVPTVPEIELKIYSLNENPTIRQAIGLYQNANPNIKITQEIGKKSSETIFADALKTLSTEVLAGNGPDIFIMDGIPVESYVNKGILLDISDIVQPKIDSGELLANILESSVINGKIYSVPAKFEVMYAQGVELGEIDSMGDILDWYENHSEVPLGITREDIGDLYPFYSIGWFNADGSLNEETMLETLKDLDRFAEVVGENKELSIRAIDNGGSVFWVENACALTMGTIHALEELSMLSSALDKREEGELKLLPTNTGGSFIPNTVLGVNAASKQTEAAKAFVAFALSLEVQEEMFYSGMPVNKAALAANTEKPKSQWGYGGIITRSYEDRETNFIVEYELKYVWPNEEFMSEFISELESLTVQVEFNRVVERIIDDPVYMLVTQRSITPEEAAKAISGDLALYLAEQQ